jgi:hypothetical protein
MHNHPVVPRGLPSATCCARWSGLMGPDLRARSGSSTSFNSVRAGLASPSRGPARTKIAVGLRRPGAWRCSAGRHRLGIQVINVGVDRRLTAISVRRTSRASIRARCGGTCCARCFLLLAGSLFAAGRRAGVLLLLEILGLASGFGPRSLGSVQPDLFAAGPDAAADCFSGVSAPTVARAWLRGRHLRVLAPCRCMRVLEQARGGGPPRPNRREGTIFSRR